MFNTDFKQLNLSGDISGKHLTRQVVVFKKEGLNVCTRLISNNIAETSSDDNGSLQCLLDCISL